MYNKLLKEAEDNNIYVFEKNLHNIAGLYADDTIVINNKLSQAEKTCVLAEEIGHHYLSYGNILKLENVSDIQNENSARIYAYNKLFGFDQIVEIFEKRINSKYEISEYLGITEDFIDEALNYYRNKYGLYVRYKEYMIMFNKLNIIKDINENNSFI